MLYETKWQTTTRGSCLIILTNFSGCLSWCWTLCINRSGLSRFKVAYLANTSDEKVTTGESVTSSISRATKYFEDAGTGSEQLELFWYNGARYGRVDIMEWAHRQGYARVRNNEQFQWRWRDVGKQVCIRAAKYGQLASLQWLRQNNCCWDDDTAYAAAAGGHFPVLQLAIDNGL